MEEIWKPIEGYDCYFISNRGRVKSIDRECIRRNGHTYKVHGKILKGNDNGLGYLKVGLAKNGTKNYEYVHRLVAYAFIPRIEGKDYINHKDCNPRNNDVSNLEWVTFRENLDYARELWHCIRTEEWTRHAVEGQRNRFRAVIGVNIATGETIYSERLNGVREFGFNPPDVHRCCNGKRTNAGGFAWRYADEKHNPS